MSGLITGQDLIKQLKSHSKIKEVDGIIIPRTMMKRDEEIFLDNLTLVQIAEELNVPLIPSKVEGKNLIDIIKN